MTNPIDLTQFGQWLAEQQSQLVAGLWKEQRQAQEQLVKGLCDAIKEQQPQGPPLGVTSALPYRLSKQT